MQTRKLGFSDLHLTTIGLGTWAIGGEWKWGWGPQDDQESLETIHRALDLGINWIDTAAAYGLGHSEELVGRAIAGKRDQVIVATKCGLVWEEGGWEVTSRLTAESVRCEAEASLRRLNIDVIDLYQIHWPVPDEDIEEAWGVIADLVREGKIRYGGVSNFSVDQMKRVQAIHPIASLQPEYSMWKREPEEDLLDYCAANDIGVVAYSPMRSGLLTGRFTRERMEKLDEHDWRRADADFQEPRFSVNLVYEQKLRELSGRYGRPLSQLAIAWVLARPEVTAAIVGARRPRQIEENSPAGDWTLSPEQLAEISALLKERDQQMAAANTSQPNR